MHKAYWALFVLVAMLASATTGIVVYSLVQHRISSELHAKIIRSEIQPLAILVRENQALLLELQSAPFTDQGGGVLESYLAKIHRDGLSRHADMKQRLDTLAENNTAIVTLMRSSMFEAKTSAYVAESDKFRNYASAWRDRWNSLMELFMAGGSYATSETPFPVGLPDAVRGELGVTR